jgi:predicted regulator of Ras-like GTPase activity (Roadblock/LC7/MglB family)
MDAKSLYEPDRKELTFTRILENMNEAGRFHASFLVDAQGLPIAAVTTRYDTDTASAMVSMVRNAIVQLQTGINLAEADEVTTRGNDKTRLISRYFKLGDEALILVVIAPPNRSYRKLTSQAIKAFQTNWAS